LKKHLILVAGGTGTRMSSTLPKQFIEIGGTPVIVHTIKAFLAFDAEIMITVVLPEAYFDTWHIIASHHPYIGKVQLVAGGATRFQSVKNGLQTVSEDIGLVAVHDAVRPAIHPQIIHEAFASAENNKAAIVCVALKDSIRKIQGQETVAQDRADFLLVQTPQIFDTKVLKKAYLQEDSVQFTDDASVVEAIGIKIAIVEGSYQNIKITTDEDLPVVSNYFKH
jgi:2-C-methyl-D-erythritol 4-phosphate cytidylyltransferase